MRCSLVTCWYIAKQVLDAYYSIEFYKTNTKAGRYYIERVKPIDNYYSKLNILKGLDENGR